jgi:hypothetical protein
MTYKWKDDARCLGMDTNIFFDKYEEDQAIAARIDNFCRECPVRKQCFAVGVSNKEWGVWGGVYLKEGNIDREFNQHKTKQSWFDTWQSLTMEVE